MISLTIDGVVIQVSPGTSVLQACEQLGVEIPRFCYHDRLSVAGNCRMCLVEMERSPKLIASCAMPCAENMVIHTQSDKVKEGRRGVMEFLLINHPLDCPICDQGGECDLQDQAMAYGFDSSRYHFRKRAVKNKSFGPLIKTHMTRCIHCTRCIRFYEEVAGVSQLGAIGRGEHVEIDTFIESGLHSELSGNLTDICPVGALLSKPYQFTARPWEIRKTETIDIFDAVGSNIRVDTRGDEVMRILPRLHEDINEEWISDKTRFAYDGLKRQRLDRPYLRDREGKLQAVDWSQALNAVAQRMTDGSRVAAIAGDCCDTEAMTVLKDLLTTLGSPHFDCRQEGGLYDSTARAGYLFNSTISGIEKADVILLIGTNPRYEAPLINARIYKRYRRRGLTVASIGAKPPLNYPYQDFGPDVSVVERIAQGEHEFCESLAAAAHPMLILGMGALSRPDGLTLQALARRIADKYCLRDEWNGYNVLHTASARVGGLDIGFVPQEQGFATKTILAQAEKGSLAVLYLLDADELDLPDIPNQTLLVYQGHHGDRSAAKADVILPGAAYTEKNGTYVNTEGRPQLASRALFPPGQAQEDWKIIRALSEKVGRPLPYDTLLAVRERMVELNPIFDHPNRVIPARWEEFGRLGVLDSAPLTLPITNFYQTNTISRASPTMEECARTFLIDG